MATGIPITFVLYFKEHVSSRFQPIHQAAVVIVVILQSLSLCMMDTICMDLAVATALILVLLAMRTKMMTTRTKMRSTKMKTRVKDSPLVVPAPAAVEAMRLQQANKKLMRSFLKIDLVALLVAFKHMMANSVQQKQVCR